MTAMEMLSIRTENRFRSLISNQAYTRGATICRIPDGNVLAKATRHTVQIGRDEHIEVGKLAALNHSCDPNVILDTANMLVIARYDIARGDDLSFFYPSTEWEMAAPFICLCGSPNCIHVVAGARFLSLSTLENHFLNKHIRDLMIELLNNTGRHLRDITEK
jgi:hypothetical protein